MTIPCRNCSEDFDQTEHVEDYCSWECAQQFADRRESEFAYREGRYSGAPATE